MKTEVVYRIYGRMQVEINTDPQRRCYWGCHASSELVWTEWCHLGTVFTQEDAEASVNCWGMTPDKDRQYKWVKEERIVKEKAIA